MDRKHKANCFQVATDARTYYIFGDTEEDRDDWIKAISTERDRAQGKTKKEKSSKKKANGRALLEDVSVDKEACLGTGSFGPVFEGKLAAKAVVVKQLQCNEGQEEDMTPTLLKGARKWCAVSHPHVASIHGIYRDEHGAHYVVTDMLGSTLEDSLFDEASRRDEGEDMSGGTKERIRACLQIAEAVSALHNAGVVHGGLTSWNIFCSPGEERRECMVADFGLAPLARFDSRGHFKDGVLFRSKMPVRWCAPEVLKRGAFSAMGDVWSFGVVMWEIFSLHDIPYGVDLANSDIKQSVAKRDGERLTQPPLCPEAMFALMQRCWSYSRKERPAMQEVCEELRKILEDEGAHGLSTSVPKNPRLSVLKQDSIDSENDDTTEDADDDSDDDEYDTEDEDEDEDED